ncbi:MAG: glycosyltransferase family 4 protein [Candidatus Thermoplasmatota archaeon]|nr:glycosyltransferase family 4 protein [Candidatus Thermoplasmatota archaeon]
MRVCLITNYLPSYHAIWGGAEQTCYRLAQFLTEEVGQVIVLSSKPKSMPRENFDFYCIATTEDLFKRAVVRARYLLSLFDPISFYQSYKLFRKIKPDIAHFHKCDRFSLSIIKSAKLLGIPTLFTIYDYWCICANTLLYTRGKVCTDFHNFHCAKCLSLGKRMRVLLWLRKRCLKALLKSVDAFIVFSNSSKQILESYGIKSEKIHVIHHFFHLVEEKIEDVQEDRILFVGWLEDNKGIFTIIEAMPYILKEVPTAKLIIVGSGSKQYEAERLIKKLKLEEYISLVGKKPYAETEKLIKRSNVVVVPEQWPNMSPVIIAEAMAFGKPVVASMIGGIPEFIKDGYNGFLTNPKEPIGFAEKIIRILKDRDLALRIGKNARISAKQIFDKDRNLEKLLQIYNSLAKR